MANKENLEFVLALCEKTFGKGLATLWKHGDYVDLSQEILKATKVTISPNTLKRLFGKISVDEDYLPQQATLNALKEYCKFDATKTPQKSEVVTIADKKKSNVQTVLILCTILFALSAYLIYKVFGPIPLEGNISIDKQLGQLPATVYFDIKTPNTTDSFFVDFGDKSTPKYILPNQKSIGHNYVFPDVFDVKLYSKKQIIGTTKVTIVSNKWLALAFNQQRDIPKRYYEFPAIQNFSDSLFHVSNKTLTYTGLDTVGTLYTRLCNYRNTNYRLDDFTFESTFKNYIVNKGVYCGGAQFQITGENQLIRFKFVNEGCSFRVLNRVGEKVYDGQTDNLSVFTLDLSHWNTIKIVNQNKNVNLFVNNRLVFEDTYQNSLGEIKGVFVEFEGNGFIKTCKLSGNNQVNLFEF